MGKLNKLRRAILKDPDSWVCRGSNRAKAAVIYNHGKRWKPQRVIRPSGDPWGRQYRSFVRSVLRSLPWLRHVR